MGSFFFCFFLKDTEAFLIPAVTAFLGNQTNTTRLLYWQVEARPSSFFQSTIKKKKNLIAKQP